MLRGAAAGMRAIDWFRRTVMKMKIQSRLGGFLSVT